MKFAKSIEEYMKARKEWSQPLQRLRSFLNSTELEEKLKWGMPVYTLNNKNVVGLVAFKHHYGLWFYQGVFLSDPYKVLQNAQEGKTKGMRHLKYHQGDQLEMDLVKSYVAEAIENQKLGKVIKAEKSVKNFNSPYLEMFLSADDELMKCFAALSNYKQQEYHEYVVTAKQEKTKERRMEKSKVLILQKKGLNDLYRK